MRLRTNNISNIKSYHEKNKKKKEEKRDRNKRREEAGLQKLTSEKDATNQSRRECAYMIERVQ